VGVIAAVPAEYRAMFVCVALTGVRLGELLALKWRHVDFENRVLQIQQSLWGGEVQTPKTQASIRTICYGEALAAALTERMQVSTHIGLEDFIFSKSNGESLHPDIVRRDVLYPVLDRLGIDRGHRSSGFHAFRHAAASLINARTGDLKLAQKLLGHSTLSMTANVYTHTYGESERKAAIELERAIFGEKPVQRTVERTVRKLRCCSPSCSFWGTGTVNRYELKWDCL